MGGAFVAEPKLKEYDGKALGDCDGIDSKPACVAVDGFVYDVSVSKLWKGGLHMKRHPAGQDFSGDIAAAPHGKEVLERVPRVGTMKKEAANERPMPAWLAVLLEKVPFLQRHPHPMAVHFPIVFMFSATFFSILYMITGERSFEKTAFYCLAGGILFTPPAMITGWFTWWLNYMAKPMGAVTIKKRLSWLLLAISIATFLWRFCVTDILETTGTGHVIYSILLLSLVLIVSAIGYYGGKLTFPTGKRSDQ
jgi:predicted heme/steroid binding protein/uncharacterized membrane protein